MKSDIKPEYDLFGKYRYGMKPNMIMVFENNDPVFYIAYKEVDGNMYITNVENISDTKNLSFKIYAGLLHRKVFKKIYTGSTLSSKNISANKKYLEDSKDFALYISDGNTEELVTKDTFDDIINASSDKTQFVLKSSTIFEAFRNTYSASFITDLDYDLVTDFIDNCPFQ